MKIKFNLKKILVPIDFSELSLYALDYAAEFARHSDASITVLHVIEDYDKNVLLSEVININDVLKKAVQDKLNELRVKKKNLYGLKITAELAEGKIHKQIEYYANEKNYDLVVMGTHGATGTGAIEKYVIGSNAYRTVHQVNCPVITLREPKYPIKFDKIVLPLDLTKTTTQKVDSAIKIAKVFGSTIHAISVSSYLDEFTGDVEKLRPLLRKVAKRIKDEGVPCVTKTIRHEDIVDSVLEYAEKIDADLIVIMTRQESKWNIFTIGSNAAALISKSRIPVLSLKPQKMEE